MFDLGKNLFKHKTGNQEHSLKAASLEPKRFMCLYLRLWAAERVAEMRARDWLPALSSRRECPYLGSTQLHPLIPSRWADAVRTINLPGWALCHVWTAKNTPTPALPPPPRLKVMPITLTSLILTLPRARHDHAQNLWWLWKTHNVQYTGNH